jgi:xylulokinase
MYERYLLGFDIGTYSSKGVLTRKTGEVVASRSVEHPLEMPRSGWTEHDAEATWWKDFSEITAYLLQNSAVSPEQIAGIGLSSISPAVLPIDRQGKPLRKAILYGIDTRATGEIAELQQIIDADPALCRSGVQLSSQSASPKVLWIRRHEPGVWAGTHLVVNGSGFLLYRLTGNATLDVYDAVSFAPFVEAEKCSWKTDAIRFVAPPEKLPRLTWTCEIGGRVTAQGARMSGLAEGTPIITGTADAAAEAVSAGLSRTGDMLVMYGSSIFFILLTPQLFSSPHFWCTPFLEKGSYVLTGGMSTSGSLTKWFRDQFAPVEMQSEMAGGENAYSALARLASSSPVGANGLIMLPYFSGERTPILDPEAKGVVFGLGLHHTRADLYRAALESVGYGIRHNIDQMKLEGADPKRFLAAGGGTCNPLWMQIVSDIAGIEQHIPEQRLGACYGDAFLAGVGVGLFSGTAEAAQWARIGQVVTPQANAHREYEGYYRIYRELYPSTATLMSRLGAQTRSGTQQSSI